MPRALLSVSDKTGIVEFARGLADLGFEILSTGGTARALREAGLHVIDVSDVTGHPEMMDGRVKTLHPAVHAGILARRDQPADLEALAARGYGLIDLVGVNLYPFHEAAAARAPIPEAMEQVDIGGPGMLRSAAKNHRDVIIVVDPHDYARVLDALASGKADRAFRTALAAKVFAHTAAYDAAIARYMEQWLAREKTTAALRGGAVAGESDWPDSMVIALRHAQPLRYGENPDQPAAFYTEPDAPPGSLGRLAQLHGKQLSFNNLLDVDAAVSAVSAWHGEAKRACVIVKHTTPCGVALGDSGVDAWARALACDPVSAFGGIVAFNGSVDAATADAIAATFLEIVVAPAFDEHALEILRRKKNLRLIVLPAARAGDDELDAKRVRGGFLIQARMRMSFPESAWQVRTRRAPTAAELDDLRFAWRVAASVKSNAIVLARDARTIGIGAGQMSRVDASRIAVMKAADQNADLKGSVLASDAFFPFRDGIDAAAKHGVAAVIQPGGSVRDDEVIAAAEEHGIAMIFTGRRVFRH
ncbi:MAG: bifunctional phosphoribosylaminoimidazolecarboxamide formyltransferase/IMP cyclohydrolase [Gemmatimonadetes bacterium]|nr:bifunctional phosphoribosylaminoimidazolecarboxamide formyltransferase/IMP cyclohydrolase [Gemmatimonadota bacterium]